MLGHWTDGLATMTKSYKNTGRYVSFATSILSKRNHIYHAFANLFLNNRSKEIFCFSPHCYN